MIDAKEAAIFQAAVCIKNNDFLSAENIISNNYNFSPEETFKRRYTIKQMTEQFFKDGFIDRYSGKHLINPGMLRVISELIPNAFPYHSHWKADKCHKAYWQYQPTIDHICPVSLGGKDSEENWATTSMINNLAKSNFTLEQLGWTLKEKGDIKDWDGMSKLFIEIADNNKSLLELSGIKNWYVQTKICLDKFI